MNELGIYVVRVYRRNDLGMAGVVESVATGDQVHFQSDAELWCAIRDLPSSRRFHQPVRPNEEGMP